MDEQQLKNEWGRISSLLQDMAFARSMASHQVAAFNASQTGSAGEITAAADSQAGAGTGQEDIAINLAGFYALECGLGYLSGRRQKLPSTILLEILTDSLPEEDRDVFRRFANATWKAGQPYRSLDRITRPVFISYDLLPEAEKEKDWLQIQSAARKLEEAMK